MRRKKGTEEIFDVIIAENFLKLMRATEPWIQEAQRIVRRINTEKPIFLHFIFKLQKTKDEKT